MIKPSSNQRPFGTGLIVSAILHVLVLGLVVLGLPVFWAPEPLPEAIGVQLAQLSDITAAPKSNKVNNEKIVKKPDAPKQDQPKKEEPKPETPPPPPKQQPAATPPPPESESKPAPTPPAPPKEEEAQKIPDPEKKPEEKKPEEKKPEEKKPEKKVEKKPDEVKKKPDKTSDEQLNALLNDVLKEAPAPDTKEKTSKKAQPAPAEQSEGPKTSQYSEIPLTAAETDGIAAQVQPNWNVGSLAGAPDFDKMVVTVHVSLQPDGTITAVQVDNDQPGNPYFRQAMESAKRALLITKQLKLPPGKTYEKVTFRFRPADFQ